VDVFKSSPLGNEKRSHKRRKYIDLTRCRVLSYSLFQILRKITQSRAIVSDDYIGSMKVISEAMQRITQSVSQSECNYKNRQFAGMRADFALRRCLEYSPILSRHVVTLLLTGFLYALTHTNIQFLRQLVLSLCVSSDCYRARMHTHSHICYVRGSHVRYTSIRSFSPFAIALCVAARAIRALLRLNRHVHIF